MIDGVLDAKLVPDIDLTVAEAKAERAREERASAKPDQYVLVTHCRAAPRLMLRFTSVPR